MVAEAEQVPRDRGLYLQAARLSRAERTVAQLEAQLVIVDAELASPEFTLTPAYYQDARRAERPRLEAERDQARAEQAAMIDEARRSTFIAMADPEGHARVLASLRWRDAAPLVASFRQGCQADPTAVDGTRLRDFASGMAMLEHDGHGVGTRMLEERILAGDDLTGVVP